MTEPHRALIVEDDETIAEDMREILAAMSCDAVIATNKEDALAHLDKQAFCFVLLDLQIKQLATSIKGHFEYGSTLLRETRARFREHSGRCYVMPIVVITGSQLDVDNVVEIMRDGADHFIQKPAKSRTISDAVRSVLERSGRLTHAHCIELSSPATPTTAPAAPRLTIPGQREGRRTIVRINGANSALPNSSLRTFLQLMVGHLESQPVHKRDMFENDSYGFKAISLLRDHLSLGPEDGRKLIESVYHGYYRLRPDVVIGECNTTALLALDDSEISALATRLRQLLDGPKATKPKKR